MDKYSFEWIEVLFDEKTVKLYSAEFSPYAEFSYEFLEMLIKQYEKWKK